MDDAIQFLATDGDFYCSSCVKHFKSKRGFVQHVKKYDICRKEYLQRKQRPHPPTHSAPPVAQIVINANQPTTGSPIADDDTDPNISHAAKPSADARRLSFPEDSDDDVPSTKRRRFDNDLSTGSPNISEKGYRTCIPISINQNEDQHFAAGGDSFSTAHEEDEVLDSNNQESSQSSCGITGCVLEANPMSALAGSIAAVTGSSAASTDDDDSYSNGSESPPKDDDSSSPPVDHFDSNEELLDYLFDISTTHHPEPTIHPPPTTQATSAADDYEDLSNYLLPKSTSFRFQMHEAKLLHIVKDNNLPPHVFDLVMSWASEAHQDNYDFTSKKYKTLMKDMIEHYIPAECHPVEKKIVVEGVPETKMYVFPLLPQLKRLYADEQLMEGALWHFHEERKDGERVYSEINTADLWRFTEEQIQSKLDKNDPDYHKHCPAIILPFDDATNCDDLGRLTCQMVMFSVANINGKKRRSAKAYCPAGIIPPYPKTSAERARDRNKAETKLLYLRYYHKCLELLWEDLLEMEKKSTALRFRVATGEHRILYPRLGFVIGDTKGHDDMVCHYNCHSAAIQKMVRDCDVPSKRGDDPDYECTPTVMGDLLSAVEAARSAVTSKDKQAAVELLKSLSQHPVISYYFNFCFGGMPGGICSIGSPFEILHVFYLGIMKMMLNGIFNICKVPHELDTWHTHRVMGNPEGYMSNRPDVKKGKNTAIFPAAEFEARIRYVQSYSRRQSDRDMPRTPFKNGVTELTRLNGQEYPGLCLLTCICLKGIFHSQADKKIPEERVKELILLEKSMALLIFLALSLELRLTAPSYTESELENLQKDIVTFLKFFRNVLGKYIEAGSKTGLRRPKFHAMLHFVRLIVALGATTNFFGGFLEALQKIMVKAPCTRTSRKHSSFQREILHRWIEHLAVQMDKKFQKLHEASRAEVMQHCPASTSLPAVTISTKSAATRISNSNRKRPYIPGGTQFRCDSDSSGVWSTFANGKKVGDGKCIHPGYKTEESSIWVKTLCQMAQRHEKRYNRVLFLYHVDTPGRSADGSHETFRCHPNYSGSPWHDWCMVNFKKNTGEVYISAARVCLWGMFAYQDGPEGEEEVASVEGEEVTVEPLFAIVHPLRSGGPPPKDSILSFGQTDHLAAKVTAVDFDSIESVAYVLPINKKREHPFPKCSSDPSAYFVTPPRTTWATLCWDHPLLTQWRNKIISEET